MNKLIKLFLTWVFGERVEGEPINMDKETKIPTKVSYPENYSDKDFFVWGREFRVGCCTHNKPVFY